MKRIILICCSNNEICSHIAKLLHFKEEKSTFCIVNPHLVQSFYQHCREEVPIEEDILLYRQFDVWTNSILKVFSQSIENTILNDIDAEKDLILLSKENTLFINVWREFCKNTNIKLRIVHIRDFNWNRAEDAHISIDEFRCAVHIAIQSDNDIYCFTNDDIDALKEQAVNAILGNTFSLGAQSLFIQNENHDSLEKLPLELQILSNIFEKKRLGSCLFKIKNFDNALAFLQISSHPNSAFSLSLGNDHLPSSNVLSAKLFLYEECLIRLQKTVRDTRTENIQLEKKINSLSQIFSACGGILPASTDIVAFLAGEIADIDPQRNKVSPPKITTKAAPQKKTLPKAVPQKKTSPKAVFVRKYAKLKKNPSAFFNDSQKPFIRFLGRVCLKIK